MTGDLDGLATIVCRVGKIRELGPDDDYYEAGLSSINALELLLEVESACDVSIPDDRFIAVRTLRGLHEMVALLKQGQAA
jgi:acyl carrier protein